MRKRAVIVVSVLTMCAGSATLAFGQTSCLSHPSSRAAASSWAAPLDRAVSVHERTLSLRSALERIAAAGRVRLSYSADLLPPDRQVCLDLTDVAIGAALSDLLAGSTMQPIVAGADQIVLAPSRGPTSSDRPAATGRSIGVLERVVVTGTAEGAAQRGSPFALDVLDGKSLGRTDASSLMQAFDAAVPGLWMWTQSPTSLLARYGSVRGASSFGVSTPKIYIDGIEVANPLLFTQFDPERIDRIEVIRGPQGAALYGADAISGVVNIISRHDAVPAGDQPRELRMRYGVSPSDFMPRGALVSDNAFTMRAGNGRRSAGLGLNFGTIGQYVPGGSAMQFMGDGNVRVVGSRSVVTGIVRFTAKDAGTFVSPLLAALPNAAPSMSMRLRARSGPDSARSGPPNSDRDENDSTPFAHDSGTQSIRQYTIGSTATIMSSPRWTHTVVAGVDGYRLRGLSSEGITIPSPSDSALMSARGGVDRTTLRWRSVAHFGTTDGTNATVTLAAENSATREQTLAAPTSSQHSAEPFDVWRQQLPVAYTDWWTTSGILAQVNGSIGNSLFVTAGGRVESSSGAVSQADAQVAMLPMLGAAVVREHGNTVMKLRASYGTGIRPTRSVIRGATWMNRDLVTYSLATLQPESQSGIEVGADLLFGRMLGVHLTRFDQRASGLIQAVAVSSSPLIPRWQTENFPRYELQNVGAIANHGWELQATSRLSRLNLTGAWSMVDSRVDRLAPGYSGDVRPGDRMLEVPSQTVSLTAGWVGNRWATSWTAARATNWINYDRYALAQANAAAIANDDRRLTGAELRTFWREYNGATRLRGNLSFLVRRGMTLVVAGDNLFGQQRGEPDNITVIPGRTITFGVRKGF